MQNSISNAFTVFENEAPEHARCWRELVRNLAEAGTLDRKTHSLIFLSVLAVLGRQNGIPFHTELAKQAGATRDEVISAVLVGLPPAGHVVTEVLPLVIDTFDSE